MKKAIIFLLAVLIMNVAASPLFAEQKDFNVNVSLQENLLVKEVVSFLEKFSNTLNLHKKDELKNYISYKYKSADGIDRKKLFELVDKTWVNYPNLKYNFKITNVRISGDQAAVDLNEYITGVSSKKSEITHDRGVFESQTDNVIYLQRFGKSWQIVSDRILFEKTIIKYGSAKNLTVDFYAPEQVLAGETYTATLQAEIPAGMFALGSITRQPIVHPSVNPQEVFRQIPSTSGLLERVMKSNKTNNNEFAAASVGYTEMSEDANAHPDIKLTGLALLYQRVNVIPASTFYAPLKNCNKLVKSKI